MTDYREIAAKAVNLTRGLPYSEYADVYQDAMIAAWEAEKRFDSDRGMTLTNWMIGKAMWAVIDGVRLRSETSRNTLEKMRKGENVPAWHKPPSYYMETLSSGGGAQFDPHDMMMKIDAVSDETVDKQFSEIENEGWLAGLLEELPERRRKIMRMYFYDEMTMMAIANQLGVTESRISQIVKQCLCDLRGILEKRLD